MVGFIKLSIPILFELRGLGFNILRSASDIGDSDPSWVPDCINLDMYLDPYTSTTYQSRLPSKKKQMMFIDEVLLHNKEQKLRGHVFYVYKDTDI